MIAAWTDETVAEALGVPRSTPTTYPCIRTDSRAVEKGDLFVALVGERFDAHDFLEQVFAAGAGGVVVSAERSNPGATNVYLVPDTLKALGDLAALRRRALGVPVVAITGSSGKTTTKDLTKGALGASLRVHATQGNHNNRVGLPLTILSAPEDAEVLVLELGTNEPGEIAELARIAAPDIGVIVTVGESHLEGLGSLEGVMREKLDLLRALGADGISLVGEQPPQLVEQARVVRPDTKVAGVGDLATPELRGVVEGVASHGGHAFTWQGRGVRLSIPGPAAVTDALLALGVADALKVDLDQAVVGVGHVAPGSMRGETRVLGDLTLVVDCYNANPQSVRAAAHLLEQLPHTSGERVLVLGSMRELGPDSAEYHATVLADLARGSIDHFYLSGAFSEASGIAAAGLHDRATAVPEVEDLGPRLASDLAGTEVVLLKASRGERLERVIPHLERTFGVVAGESG